MMAHEAFLERAFFLLPVVKSAFDYFDLHLGLRPLPVRKKKHN